MVAIDDAKEHRTSADVWGTCTFHKSGVRSPNRATTVRTVMGDLIPGKPWTYLPVASRLYFRKNQLSAAGSCLVVIEATGGYQRQVAGSLVAAGHTVTVSI